MAGARRLFRRAPSTYQPACKPGSVGRQVNLPRDGHSSGTPVTRRLQQPTRTTGPRHKSHGSRRAPSLFGLAPGGVCRAASVAGSAVRSYRTVSPLPSAEAEWRSLLCGTFPGLRRRLAPALSPAGRYPAPHVHGARTFLPRRLSALARAAARPTDVIDVGVFRSELNDVPATPLTDGAMSPLLKD